MDGFDRNGVAAEIRAAFDAYEAALVGNDVAALTGFFWEDPRAVRMMTEGGLYGFEAISAFRRGRDPADLRASCCGWMSCRSAPMSGWRRPSTAASGRASAGRRRRSGCAGRRVGASPRRM